MARPDAGRPMTRPWGAWVALGGGALVAARGLSLLAAPTPARSDVPGFGLTSAGALLLLLGAILWSRRSSGRRAWHWWAPAAYFGVGLAALVLAYKDSWREEWPALGFWRTITDMLLHLLIAPWEVFFGFVVGFVDPWAPAYVVACLAFAVLVAEALRRRTWPRERESGDANSATA